MSNKVDRYNFTDIQEMDVLSFSGEPFFWKKFGSETSATGMNCIKLCRELYQNDFSLFPPVCTALSVTHTGKPWKKRKFVNQSGT